MRLSVEGMKCVGCATSVESAVKKVDGVRSVKVSLESGSVTIEGTVDESKVIAAVREAGYTPN